MKGKEIRNGLIIESIDRLRTENAEELNQKIKEELDMSGILCVEKVRVD